MTALCRATNTHSHHPPRSEGPKVPRRHPEHATNKLANEISCPPRRKHLELMADEMTVNDSVDGLRGYLAAMNHATMEAPRNSTDMDAIPFSDGVWGRSRTRCLFWLEAKKDITRNRDKHLDAANLQAYAKHIDAQMALYWNFR